MSFPLPATLETDTLTSGVGPAAHEDLTIAEQLETMRVADEHRPGELCYLNPEGENCWLEESDVKHFLAKHGAEHSSAFLSAHGADWQNQLFHPSSKPIQ